MSFARYGLQDNPFGGELVNPLDCPNHLSYYVTVDGFGEQKPKIDDWAGKPMTKTQFFLISGYTGTGRTSVCNYIAEKFRCNYIEDDPQNDRNILKVNINIRDEDHIGALHNWMEKLPRMANLKRVKFPPEVKNAFKEEIRNQKPPRSVTLYQELLYNVVKELSAKNWRLVAIFENVVNPQIFTLVREVFDDPDAPLPDIALAIFTTKIKNLYEDFEKINPRFPSIGLRVLTGKEVLEFISQRWEQVQAHSPQPFDDHAVKDAFNTAQYPFRRVVDALEYILNQKIKNLKPGGDWPTDKSLKLSRGEFFEFFFEFKCKYP